MSSGRGVRKTLLTLTENVPYMYFAIALNYVLYKATFLLVIAWTIQLLCVSGLLREAINVTWTMTRT
jgi:hypothetical protein